MYAMSCEYNIIRNWYTGIQKSMGNHCILWVVNYWKSVSSCVLYFTVELNFNTISVIYKNLCMICRTAQKDSNASIGAITENLYIYPVIV